MSAFAELSTIASFRATIAYGLLALALVFVANLAGWCFTHDGAYKAGMAAAMIAALLAYLAQSLHTVESKAGPLVQLASIGFGIGAGVFFLLGA